MFKKLTKSKLFFGKKLIFGKNENEVRNVLHHASSCKRKVDEVFFPCQRRYKIQSSAFSGSEQTPSATYIIPQKLMCFLPVLTNFLVWKLCFSTKFHTRKLGKITAFYAVLALEIAFITSSMIIAYFLRFSVALITSSCIR